MSLIPSSSLNLSINVLLCAQLGTWTTCSHYWELPQCLKFFHHILQCNQTPQMDRKVLIQRVNRLQRSAGKSPLIKSLKHFHLIYWFLVLANESLSIWWWSQYRQQTFRLKRQSCTRNRPRQLKLGPDMSVMVRYILFAWNIPLPLFVSTFASKLLSNQSKSRSYIMFVLSCLVQEKINCIPKFSFVLC